MTLEAVAVPSRVQFTRHEHALEHVCCVVGGMFEEKLTRGRRRCETGTLRASPAGDQHTIEFGNEGACCLIVEFDGEVLTNCPAFSQARIYVENDWLWRTARRTYRLLAAGEPFDTLTLECLAWELLTQCGRYRSRASIVPPPLWLRRVRDRLETSFADKLSIAVLAEAEGISREHLARTFRLHYGVSPADFVRRIRLDSACRRLVTTRDPLAAIAADTGFADQSHFTRCCLRGKGFTPAAFRRQNGQAPIALTRVVER